LSHKVTAGLTCLALVALACTEPTPERTGGTGGARAGPVLPPNTPLPRVTQPAGNWLEASCDLDREFIERTRRGYKPGRSPDVQMIAREPNNFPSNHAGPWDYLQLVPLVFYGPGFIRSQGQIAIGREATVADIAPTLAELLDMPFPPNRSGAPVTEALVPEGARPGLPRVVVVVVWDGGGWSALDTWPESWPFLKQLMKTGTSVTDAIVGSSPSVTPPIHATVGTGTFPKQHGIVDIPLRDGDRVVSSYDGRSPRYLDVPALADLYDLRVGNSSHVAMVGYKTWHLGMMGRGAFISGADKDIAVLVESKGRLVTNPDYYALPPYVLDLRGFANETRSVDIDDGKIDGKWLGNDYLDDPDLRRLTPVWSLHQTRMIKTIMRNEGFGDDDVPDLFFVNYKHIDGVGHEWGVLEPEMPAIIRYTDSALRDIVEFLNRRVGRRRWVLALTADHGPAPPLPEKQGFPIDMKGMLADMGEHFGAGVAEIVLDQRSTGIWLNDEGMAAHGITAEDVADFIVRYRLEDNATPELLERDVFSDRRNEPLFSAAFPSEEMGRVWACVKEP
jgi:hypothetical protein